MAGFEGAMGWWLYSAQFTELRPKVIVTNKRIEKLSRVPLPWLSVT